MVFPVFNYLFHFEKFVKCANYEADNVIFTTQSYIKCLRCAFLVNPLLKRDQSKIVINNSTCDTSLFIINSFPMAAHSFSPLLPSCNISLIFLLKNKTKQSKKTTKQSKLPTPSPPQKKKKINCAKKCA